MSLANRLIINRHHLSFLNQAIRHLSQAKPTNKALQLYTPKKQKNSAETLALPVFFLMFGGLMYMLDDKSRRENPITGKPFNIHVPAHNDLLVDRQFYQHVGKKPKGDLSGELVRATSSIHADYHIVYLKKGAQSRDKLIKEAVLAHFLNQIDHHQPKSKIMQTVDESTNIATFHTLSEWKIGYDMAEFIKRFITPEGQYTGDAPIIGLEVALAKDLFLAKQRDMKTDNYLMVRVEGKGEYFGAPYENGAWIVLSIDHECAQDGGNPPLYWSEFPNCSNDDARMNFLLGRITDLYPRSSSNRAPLANDPRVQHFIRIAKPHVDPSHVIELYRRTAHLNTQPFIGIIHSLDGREGYLSRTEIPPIIRSVVEIQINADQEVQLYEEAYETSSIKP